MSNRVYWTVATADGGSPGAEVQRLYREGWSLSAIAAYLEVTKGAVAGFLSRAGVIGERGFLPLPSLEERLGWPAVMVGGCRWIEGEPGHGPWSWCGAPLARPGGPYCRAHMARVWR